MKKTLAELIGVYEGLNVNNVSTYFLDKFINNYSTEKTILSFDEVINGLSLLDIVSRDTKAPLLKQGKFTRKTLSPDVIKGSQIITPEELTKMQAGQIPIYLNGQKVNQSDVIYDRKILALKTSFLRTKEAMATELYLNGKLVLPISKEKFTIGETEEIKKTAIDHTKESDNFISLFLSLVKEFEKENGIVPNLIEIGLDTFTFMTTDEKLSKFIKVFGNVSLTPNYTLNNVYPIFNFLGYTVKVLPVASGVDGKSIDTSKLIILSNNSEFTNVQCGLGVIENGRAVMVEAPVYIQEKTEIDPARVEIILQSAYFPLIPLPKRIKRYEITYK